MAQSALKLINPLAYEAGNLKVDALAFFKQNKSQAVISGDLMGKWTYSSQFSKDDPVCGGLLWDLFTILHNEYYPKRNQVSLFQNNLEWLHSLTGSVEGVVDFGCGSPEAIYNYALPLLRELKRISFYMPIDMCTDYLDDAVKQIGAVYGDNLRILPHHGDYTLPIHGVPLGKKLGLFLGASTNFENFPHDLKSFLAAFRRVIGQGGFLAMSIDTNIEAESVECSYKHPLHEQHFINLFYRLKRDLDIVGDLDPTAWRYDTDIDTFDYQGHAVLLASHILTPSRPQSFFIDDQHIVVGDGERLVADKSFKMPVALMDSLAMAQGYTSLGVRYDHQGRLALPIYAVRG